MGLFFIGLSLLFLHFLYSVKTSITGEEVKHKALVLATAINHGYGPQGQIIHAKLESGKEVFLNNGGTPLNTGDHIMVIEHPRKNNADSYYIYKSRYSEVSQP